jgi:hypothetical protein
MAMASPASTDAQTVTPPAQAASTEEEALFQEIVRDSPQATTNGSDCGKILETEPWCSVVLTVTRVTRPEWTGLFPTTKFFLVKRNRLGQETGVQRNWLIAKQNGQQFTAETFDQLLTTNGIAIADTNREKVIKAFVLMTLADYIEQDITFSDWTQGDWPAIFKRRFTHSITVWTKIQGLRMKWFFAFENNRLWLASPLLEINYHIGDYIDVPFQILPLPGSTEYLFRGQ